MEVYFFENALVLTRQILNVILVNHASGGAIFLYLLRLQYAYQWAFVSRYLFIFVYVTTLTNTAFYDAISS